MGKDASVRAATESMPCIASFESRRTMRCALGMCGLPVRGLIEVMNYVDSDRPGKPRSSAQASYECYGVRKMRWKGVTMGADVLTVSPAGQVSLPEAFVRSPQAASTVWSRTPLGIP